MIIDGIKYAAKCDECGKGMREGYVIEGGAEYYCSDPCLDKHISPSEFLELYGEGDTQTYYTDWSDDPDSWDDEEDEDA